MVLSDNKRQEKLGLTALQTWWQEAASAAGKPALPRSRKGSGPGDLEAIERLYLTHLAERYQYLDFRGLGITDRVPLRLPLLEMYVPLKARIQTPSGETWARQMRVAGRPLGEDEAAALGERLSEPRPVLELLRDHSGLGSSWATPARQDDVPQVARPDPRLGPAREPGARESPAGAGPPFGLCERTRQARHNLETVPGPRQGT